MKLGTFISDFKDIYKGVFHGSMLGPVLFNIFINDIFYFITDMIWATMLMTILSLILIMTHTFLILF